MVLNVFITLLFLFLILPTQTTFFHGAALVALPCSCRWAALFHCLIAVSYLLFYLLCLLMYNKWKQSPSPCLLLRRIWSFCVKVVRKNRGELPKLWNIRASLLAMGSVADSLEISPCPCVILPTFVLLGQTLRAPLSRYIWKIWPLASCLSRSIKVIGTDSDRSTTYDFLLTFHGNHGSN